MDYDVGGERSQESSYAPSMPEMTEEDVESGQEPIDMVSVFGEGSPRGENAAAASSEFGRHRRPFTQHRKSRQVKPREAKVRQSLGGDSFRENDDAAEEPAPIRPRIASEASPGLTDGIGPIDLTDIDSSAGDERRS